MLSVGQQNKRDGPIMFLTVYALYVLILNSRSV